ncbi:acetate kinase [Stutzerimonas frequens]|jgi:acetate kinase|uniref:acetate kinase n=1 Tax=Stutzerimonas frequens TaxID=2968969 RepID=UPI000DFB161B|nr:acetate kinase [Stutzerimonas frequens]MCD1639010.1 acetate kinase [Stutzerimonas stutzeri]RCL58272.1 MAG: acetate kinase [Pseudomonas sp.]MDA0423937.1 acetate kinase [Stutzerimonas frequens]QTF57911.1 acetate kinase [Stutzerimonas frequens]WRW28146.1 acetate kinase [Stutzerimonas frequens]
MSARNILVINCGSSSIKFALVNEAQATFPLQGLAECIGSPEAVIHFESAAGKESVKVPNADHQAALAQILPRVEDAAGGHLDGIGHRVVHGGEKFFASSLLTDETLAGIEANIQLAPLHNPANLSGIHAAINLFPELPQVGVFDTAFHQTMPEHAYRYAVPDVLYKEHGVRRYGFHGTSHRYVSKRAAELAGLPVENSSWLVAHLGNGCSTCAVVNGESRDTSMGLTPLEGLVMGTRSGDVDPSLHNFLNKTLGWDLAKIDNMLNKESGLKGLSGLSNDMRTLAEARQAGHPGAVLAFEVFCYRLAKSLAAMSCALPQLDGLVFTGGIGENSSAVRERTLDHLKLFGFKLDAEANARCTRGVAGEIQAEGSPRVMVVPTNEERQIALDTLALLDA